jgi:purine-binding chemotaxis protein CheW
MPLPPSHDPGADLDSLLDELAAAPTWMAPAPADAPDGPATSCGDPVLDVLAQIDLDLDASEHVTRDEHLHVASDDDRLDGDVERLVAFTIGRDRYAVGIPQVVEVARIPPITPVPNVPAWVRGVTNLRGDVISIVDLSAFLGHPPIASGSGRMLVASRPTEGIVIGLLVDRVDEIVSMVPEQLLPPAGPLDGPLAPHLRGVLTAGGPVTAVLDLDRFLQSPDIRRFEERA